jgi:sirohydrochlorin cobaltochelatase
LFANDALLLIGHGSIRYPDAGSVLHRHADVLRETNRFAQVQVALLNGKPSVQAVLPDIKTPTIRVVPFFMEDGYFTRVAIPFALGISPPRNNTFPVLPDTVGNGLPSSTPQSVSSRIVLCPAVGTHDGIAGLIERHAVTACATLCIPPRTVAVLIVGHGSSTAPGRMLALHRHASRVAATELFARVEAACLEESPFVPDVLRSLRNHPVVIVGFFGNLGSHVRDDLPALVAAEHAFRALESKPALSVRFYGAVAGDPAMVQIIMDQAQSRTSDDPAGE